MSSNSSTRPVRRRRVFYIPGYDPFHPRRYRELYRSEGAEQAQISGYALSLSPKTTGGPFGWHVSAEIEGARVETDMEVLVWSDLVKHSMNSSIVATYWQLLRTAWIYIGSGALWRLMDLRKGPVIAALYPVVILLLQAGLAALLGVGVASGLGVLAGLVALPELVLRAVQIITGAGAAVALLMAFKSRDNKLFVYYLMHDYAYSAGQRGAVPAELEARMRAFTADIRTALEENAVDEVLVVGHSSGAHIGVSVLADLLHAGLPEERPALSFLTLGQVVPMVSFLPRATRLRRDLQEMSEQELIPWYDVTAPGDGCAFALCDPVAVTGVATQAQRWPIVFSAAFTQTLSPARWKALKRRYFRLHFQYLCAFDQPKDYDYFRITAGPLTLGERLRDRQHSRSRLADPVSGYRSMSER
jgi:pimeloyl-ACP methyl ester carboxylesterase